MLLPKMACVVLVLIATAIALPAQTEKTLLSFDGADGASPESQLVQGFDGNLYGTTVGGGLNSKGTVFKVTPAGVLSTLYSFCAQTSCADGETPYAGLVQSSNGNFFGTTYQGGAHAVGTVFKITPGGALTTLYSFCSQTSCTDGESPVAGLVQASDGNFYGATTAGGTNSDGTIFRITPGGTLTTLHSFSGTDGRLAYGGLVQATNGSFYGTTARGGSNDDGTVFKITPGGTFTSLHTFCIQSGCPDGFIPSNTLIQASDGNFYGTASEGGAIGYGTVFKITAAGALTTLYSFCLQSNCTDGSLPSGTLVQAIDGNFYGTTANGGANLIHGTVFKLTPGGVLTTLYSFCSQTNCTDGSGADGGVVQATSGTFYGTVGGGGTSNVGVIYSLAVGLHPFVETLPTSGKVGATVIILGSNLTGATAVTFNGISATFTPVSKSEIKATVPTGATTGTVLVTTPGGTLKSNIKFRVTP